MLENLKFLSQYFYIQKFSHATHFYDVIKLFVHTLSHDKSHSLSILTVSELFFRLCNGKFSFYVGLSTEEEQNLVLGKFRKLFNLKIVWDGKFLQNCMLRSHENLRVLLSVEIKCGGVLKIDNVSMLIEYCENCAE